MCIYCFSFSEPSPLWCLGGSLCWPPMLKPPIMHSPQWFVWLGLTLLFISWAFWDVVVLLIFALHSRSIVCTSTTSSWSLSGVKAGFKSLIVPEPNACLVACFPLFRLEPDYFKDESQKMHFGLLSVLLFLVLCFYFSGFSILELLRPWEDFCC